MDDRGAQNNTGETSLPHQKDDIKPENLIEPEQAPPEKIITPDDYDHLPYNGLMAKSAELQNDDPKLQKYLTAARAKKISPPPPAIRAETGLLPVDKPKPSFWQKIKNKFH